MQSINSPAGFRHLLAARTRTDVGEGLVSILALSGTTEIVSFAGGFPDPATFPQEVLADLLRDILKSGDASALQYAPTKGLPGTLDFVQERLERHQGLLPRDDQIMITSGVIEALELIGKSFVDPGDHVALEGPTYLGAIMAFKSFQAEVRAFALDDQGLCVDHLEDALHAGYRPKLLYTIPDFQNPAGVSLSAERRAALVDLARRYHFLIVEDVAYRELAFYSAPPASLWSLGSDTVLQAGTFSKLFFPGVRLGWAAGPPEVVAQMILAKQNTDQCAGALGQRLLEDYGRAGMLDEQIARSNALYRARCELLMASLDTHMPEHVAWTRPRGGFFSWADVAGENDTAALAQKALEAGVAFVPGAPFYPDGRGMTHIRLAFSRIAESDIDEGVRRLAALLSDSS